MSHLICIAESRKHGFKASGARKAGVLVSRNEVGGGVKEGGLRKEYLQSHRKHSL